MEMRAEACPGCGKSGTVDGQLRCRDCGLQLEFDDQSGALRRLSVGEPCPACGDRESLRSALKCGKCHARMRFLCPKCNTPHRLVALICSRTGAPIDPRWKEGGAFREFLYNRGKAAAGFALLTGLALVVLGPLATPPAPHGDNPPPPPPLSVGQPRPQLDVVFVVDSTGSMADEIDAVKQRLQEMVMKVRSGQPAPEVRYALVTYRDRGDAFVTRKWDFTTDTRTIQDAVDSLVADGGGDTPEAVAEALDLAVNQLPWNPDQKCSKLIFLIGDAAPQRYTDGPDYIKVAQDARARGISIQALGCSGITTSGLEEFKQIASASAGDFEYLTYRQAFKDDSGRLRYSITAGGSVYTMDTDDADWRRGADEVARKHSLKAEPSASAPTGYSVLAAPGLAPAAPMENNIDSVITRKVMNEATKAGVRY